MAGEIGIANFILLARAHEPPKVWSSFSHLTLGHAAQDGAVGKDAVATLVRARLLQRNMGHRRWYVYGSCEGC